MKKFLLITTAALILLTIGCRTEPAVSNNAGIQPAASQTIAETRAEDFTVEFAAAPAAPTAEQQVDLSFVVINARGETVSELPLAHEKPMHLIVVSEDLAEFYHLHPEAQSNGSFKTSFAFKNGGKFKLYADLTPVKDNQIIKIFDLNVTGATRAKEVLKPDTKFEKTIEDLRVVMKPDADLVANKEIMLTYQVFDAATNQPATDLQKYLGETAHFVVINKDLNEFVHAHPMSRDNVKSEAHQHDAATNHSTDEKLMGQNAESIVSAHVSFPKAGIYKVWAEFQRGGKVTAFPFVVNIEPGKEEKPVDEAKIPDGAFKISVTKDGFTPSEITYRKGQPLKLAFVRTDSDNCANQIIFKDLNIKRNLPVGEVVLIDIPTEQEKTFTFACGMNMYKGQIVVQ